MAGEESENGAALDAPPRETTPDGHDTTSGERSLPPPPVLSLPGAQVAVEEARRDDARLVLDSFTLDEAILVNSPLLPYLAMIAGLIEGRAISCQELLGILRRSMRQRSFDRLPRREYVLRFLNQHPP